MSDVKKNEAPQLITVKIDGVETAVPAGTNLLEAAKTVGVDVPHYCYHEGLSIAANCRMCMVETNKHPPGKLVPGCQIQVMEGMEVTTTSARVKNQQRAVQEMLLLHHPVDCAICDQAGECRLQDYYQEYDFQPSRLDSEKWQKNKRKDLGPLIVLDQERCIMCTRCVRFMDEIAKDPVLGVFGRGTREVIDTFPGKVLDNNYSGNIVDLCPVGALLNKDNRFRARAYFLTATPSVCDGCSRGCNIHVDHFQDVTYRYRPRENPEVNQYWMCDIGRLGYHRLHEERLEEASVSGSKAASSEAVAAAAERLRPHVGSKELAVVISPTLSLEDSLALLFLAKEGLGAKAVTLSGRPDDHGDDLLLKEDRNPNRKGVEFAAQAMGLELLSFDTLLQSKAKAVLFFGTELPALEQKVVEWLAGREAVVALSAHQGGVVSAAHVALPLAMHAEGEGTFVNFEGRAQRFLPAYGPKGQCQAGWKWASQLLAELGTEHRFQSAKAVWAELGQLLPAGSLGEFNWDSVPRTHIKGVTPLSGGTVDGRPPGYRELIPLRGPKGTTAA